MAEVLDQEQRQADAPAPESAPAGAGFSEAAPVQKKKKRNRKKIVRRIVTLLIVAALLGGGIYWWINRDKGEKPAEVLTEMVTRGSITSVVEGSGAAVAKNSASVTLLSSGQVLEVNVSEGDYVHKGDPLYSIESSDAQARVNDAEKSIANYEKELSKLQEAASDLNARAEYAGRLMEVEKLKPGDTISRGQEIAKLVDDTRMLLPLYFSYVYENDIFVGQSATISIPVTMAQLSGKVHEINKVQRISPEGSKLFEVVFVMDNPGTLTADMAAGATVEANGETVYPYEPGKLDYFRTSTIKAKLSGEVAWVNLHDYASVRAGESVLTITADSSETEIASLENQLRSARKTLEDAKKNLDSLNAFAPIDGTVLSVGIHAGEEAKTGTVAVNIADTTTMKIEATVDEMYVSFVKAGMPINLTLWGDTELVGTIESVSLSAKSENGVARFPMVILVDNSEELLMSGAYVNYSFTASQSDDCMLVPIQCVKSAQTVDGENCKVLFVQSDVPPENVAQLSTNADVGEGFYPVVVEVGISDNHNVEILSGVEEGTVVYAGVMSSDEGMGIMF